MAAWSGGWNLPLLFNKQLETKPEKVDSSTRPCRPREVASPPTPRKGSRSPAGMAVPHTAR